MLNLKTTSRVTIRVLVACVVFIFFFLVSVSPILEYKKVMAEGVCDIPDLCESPTPPVAPGTNVIIVGNQIKEVEKKIQGFWNQLGIASLMALMNAMTVFSQRIAADAATQILSGGEGQGPLFHPDKWGDYYASVARSAGDQFLSTINDDLMKKTLGFDMCSALDPIKLQISLGITPTKQLQSDCTFAKLGKAFEQTGQNFEKAGEHYRNVNELFKPANNDLIIGVTYNNKYLDEIQKNSEAALRDRMESGGLKVVTDVISGKIKTPAEVMKTNFEEMNAIKQDLKIRDMTFGMMAENAFRVGIEQLGIVTVATFGTTLASGLIKKFFEGISTQSVDVETVDLIQPESVTNRNREKARILFSDLLTPSLISTDQKDFIGDLSGCPEPRSLWGCSMDEALTTALRTVGEDGAYTVGRASHVVLNGSPPSNPQFLHKDWELIPESDVKINTDPSCYQRAYCATNLVKLRYARILPVGWEMAANSPHNKKKNGKYVTLEEVIRGFNVCNEEGKGDSAHPWCKLIDPNWVLAAPPFECRVKGYGDVVFSGASMRLEECADAVSCLGRDDRGKCDAGYGYCLAEKPTWRFSADACLERFASCRTYKSRAGDRVSFLRNTIDYGSCSADNVGCLWYASKLDATVTSTESWLGDLNDGPRMYFDATVETCSAKDDGCTALLAVNQGAPALNLVNNGSFEQTVEGNEKQLVGWSLGQNNNYESATVTTGESAENGNNSFEVKPQVANPADSTVSDEILMYPNRYYTVSAWFRSLDTSKQGNVRLSLLMKTKNGSFVNDSDDYYYSNCSVTGQHEKGLNEYATDPSGEWVRKACTFVTPALTASGYIVLSGTNALIDSIQLEEVEKAIDFVDGVSTALATEHLRVAPDELMCTGLVGQHPKCDSYARVCKQTDQGCQGYVDVDNPNTPEIPASLTAVDYCPAMCVGYAEYRKEPTAFDLGKNTLAVMNDPYDDTSATFIPAYAKQCTAENVGCEEFTDVGTTSTGAEGKSYFNYVRACEKPSDRTQTYFTWEGSDTTGYQLRTWSLINDVSKHPAPPKIIQKAGPDSIYKDSSTCNETTWLAGTDSDCRQIYNVDGDVFYAFFSQTVTSDSACKDMRKNNSNVDDCEKTGGTFVISSRECIYKVLPAESLMCSSESAGCRAYMGTAGRNTTVVFEENFRNGTSTHPFTFGELSNESVLVGDQSLKIMPPTKTTATSFDSFEGSYYKVSFWAKTIGIKTDLAKVLIDGAEIGTMQMSSEWRRYEFGPFKTAPADGKSWINWQNFTNVSFLDEIRIERLADMSYVIKDSWTIPAVCDRTPEGLPEPQAMLGCRKYVDRNQVEVNVRRFGHLCSEATIGCKAFIDTRNSAGAYAQSFSTQGTSENSKVDSKKAPIEPAYSFEQKYLGDTAITRPADRYVYLIDEEGARCESASASCRAFGKPNYAQDQLGLKSATDTQANFETVYLIDNINKYLDSTGEPGLLCRKNELFCDEFKSGKTVGYFRNPLDHTCEWKDKVVLKANEAEGIPLDAEYAGWFRKGTNLPCYKGFISSGNTFLIQNGGDASYSGWVGMCPVEQSECTEFRDPNDHTDPAHVTGKPYYFIKNSHLDLTSCNGTVDLLGGCVLFRDMTDARNRYSSVATYADSKEQNDIPVAPVDCVNDPDNKHCEANKVCTNMKVVSFVTPGDKEPETVEECIKAGWAQIGSKDAVACDGSLGSLFQPECQKALAYCTGPDAVKKMTGTSCKEDSECSFFEISLNPNLSGPSYKVEGKCEAVNDANQVMKVKLDRDCAQWLGCATSETVFDQAQQKYVDLCTEVAMCNKTKSSADTTFCGNYINRNEDPVMKPGVFFNSDVYVSRKVGFGEMDYSGYTIPDQFQAADLKNYKVGYDLFNGIPEVANKFALDYRLVAVVSESTGLIDFPANVNIPANPLYPGLNLCTHKQTGRVGYFIKSSVAGSRVCYFAIDTRTVRSLVSLNNLKSTDPRNVEPLSDVMRQADELRYNKTLMEAFPPSECKAYPEPDSPFPNFYVKEWDTSREPYIPKEKVFGYDEVNYCEWGEECSCSYRKVKYDGEKALYYSAFGKSPAGGICIGGSKAGQSCVPNQTNETKEGDVATEDPGCSGGGRCSEISDVTLVRGEFGQCLQRDYSRSVADDPGRHPCLIWNPAPILAGSFDSYHYLPKAGYTPPVNAGEYYCLSYADPPFETLWSAQSRTLWYDSRQRASTDGGNEFLMLPGMLSKFNYDRGYIAGWCPSGADVCGPGETYCNCLDGDTEIDNVDAQGEKTSTDASEMLANPAASSRIAQGDSDTTDDLNCYEDPLDDDCDEIWRFQNLGVNIDGVGPTDNDEQNYQAQWCGESAATIPEENDDEDGGDGPPGDPTKDQPGIGWLESSPDASYNVGRWIMTGRGISKTQLEYFFPVKPAGVAKWLNNSLTGEINDDILRDSLLEKQFSQFQFFVQNDGFNYACSLPKFYIDNPPDIDFKDVAAVKQASNVVVSQFSKDFDGILDRSKEVIVKDSNNQPIREKCSGLNDGREPDYASDDGGYCYMKAWELNYHLEGVPKFNWLEEKSGMSFYDRHVDPGYWGRERLCSKSGFAIRAVFENTDIVQNNIKAEDIEEPKLVGPWQFVGFWVTSCVAGTNFETFLYLGLKVKHVDVCKELAQVVSPFSRENAAFADRVWSDGSFSIPLLGYNYSSQNMPFGSALVNGIPGIQPLFQGGEVSFSPLKPPTFLASGEEYFNDRQTPIHRWSHLSNVFAKIYRIYRYSDSGVSSQGYACIGGPSNGVACPDKDTYIAVNKEAEWEEKTKEICGGIGTCDEGAISEEETQKMGICNSLSGVNSGLSCGEGFDAPYIDPICHNAAVLNVNGSPMPLYTGCYLRNEKNDPRKGDWKICDTGGGTQVTSPSVFPNGDCVDFWTAYSVYNAFGCGDKAVIPGAACGKPDTKSPDCPLLVKPQDFTGKACVTDISPGPGTGHCGQYGSGNFNHAVCWTDDDCAFGPSQWWGAYDGPHLPDMKNNLTQVSADETYSYAVCHPPACDGDQNNTLNNGNFAMLPFHSLYLPYPRITPGPNLTNRPVWAQRFSGGFLYSRKLDDTKSGPTARYPQASLANLEPIESDNFGPDRQLYVPGLCEGYTGSLIYPTANWDDYPTEINGENTNQVPGLATNAAQAKWNVPMVIKVQASDGTIIGSGPDPDDTDDPRDITVGLCRGGVNDEQRCMGEYDCKPLNVEAGVCSKVIDDNGEPIESCKMDFGTKGSEDPDLDDNSCTQSAGYKPRQDICGMKNPEECLIGYDINNDKSLDPNENLTPTDVTAGFHNPIFYGLKNDIESNYDHIAYYAPRPPTIVAPDLSSVCQTPGQCPIAEVGTFILDEQTEGPLYYAGGQGQVSLKFYGWAAHNQSPLKNLFIDWGDGTITRIENARMKNKKPFCEVTTECELVDGLTCSSDADCPAGSGKCVQRGTCASRPSEFCSKDADCRTIGREDDKCNIREMFGNSSEACEANYFEFAHAYTCDREKVSDKCLEANLDEKYRCNRNPDLTCTPDANGSDLDTCGAGDKCIAGLAPSSVENVSGGCFDSKRVVCRYTPKVMLQDNWGWCSGECRAGSVVGNTLADKGNSKVKHMYGGCWDGTKTTVNMSFQIKSETKIMDFENNECSLQFDPLADELDQDIRPWVVYQGSVNVGIIQ